jgi:hypothetical protein
MDITNMSPSRETRGWPVFVARFNIPNRPLDIKTLRGWCKSNLKGRYHLDDFRMDRILAKGQKSVAGLIYIKDDEDQMLFKLRWNDYR